MVFLRDIKKHMMRIYATLFLCLFALVSRGQKKIMDHADFDRWNTIENEAISPDGRHLIYSLERGEADQFLKLRDADGQLVFAHDRAEKGSFTHDSEFVLFTIKAWKDSVMEMKRRKVKKDALPKDSLGIYRLSDGRLEKIPGIHGYKVPRKWSGYIAYQLAVQKQDGEKAADSTQKEKGRKEKKPGKKNGYHLVVRQLASGVQDTFHFVTDYRFAREGKRLVFATTGKTEEDPSGVYVLDLEKELLRTLHQARGAKYYQMHFSKSGDQLGFVADTDTTKVQVRPTALYYWNSGMSQAKRLAGPGPVKDDLRPSRYADLHFSDDETRMYFGLAEPPVIRDTSLLEEEIAKVEVWTWDEPRLYTVQEMQIKNDTVKAYTSVADLKSLDITQLASEAYPDLSLGAKGNARYALASTSMPYELQRQWLGYSSRDYALVDVEDGSSKKIFTGLSASGGMDLSPEGSYVYGYDRADSTWVAYDIDAGISLAFTRGQVFYNELHDSPSHPRPYGAAGWLEKDEALILYDRYDLWKFDPKSGDLERLTRGRETRTVYRYVDLDPEEESLDAREAWLLTTFDETDKSSGYASFDPRRGTLRPLLSGPYRYSRPVKAEEAGQYLFTRESFREFPDLHLSGPDFEDPVRISHANPQQQQYRWGTNELVQWRSLDGRELTGMLVKPDGFDPNKQYPMIVNFYEKSSDRLHRHWTPSPGRSTINYSFYTSRGYLIFNPDVYYREGYPGESAYNCVIPGVTSLIEKGFVDPDRIGVQGHSWGGYQIAYLVTKTNLFKAAEAGAPVPNMISAYGGIRWWTGLSRQFQYEHTQSRIGGTPWEYPMRYVENSPIFNIDKIQTPLLIMHNDADGHVPWYQGIEFFVSLRRLGKPSWFLNYNGEPHWPLKRQNRKDFNIRLAQFFDYYLKDAPKPVWMERGVPALEKGINQGYELMETGQ